MIPGFNKLAATPEMEEALEGDQLKYIEAMILSMTLDCSRNGARGTGKERRLVMLIDARLTV